MLAKQGAASMKEVHLSFASMTDHAERTSFAYRFLRDAASQIRRRLRRSMLLCVDEQEFRLREFAPEPEATH